MILCPLKNIFTVVMFTYFLLNCIFPSSSNSFLSAPLSKDSGCCCSLIMVSKKSSCLFSDYFTAFNCTVVFLLDFFRFAGSFEVSPYNFLFHNFFAVSEKINVKFRQKKNHSKAVSWLGYTCSRNFTEAVTTRYPAIK